MADVNAEGRHTARELAAAAAAEGLPASERTIRKWVQLGLLDRPTVQGLGRGRGTVASWPDDQRELFLTLVRARQAGKSIPQLCRLPVRLWLLGRDDCVPLRQTRRAIATWTRSATNPAWIKAQKGANRVAKQVVAPGTRRQVTKRFRQVMATQAAGEFNRPELLDAARDAVDGRRLLARGPEGAKLHSSTFAALVGVQVEAASRLPETTDDEFILARQLYAASKTTYTREQPRFASDPEIGQLFELLTDEEELDAACIDLITVLGALHLLTTSETHANA